MKVIVGSFYHEATTFNPFLTEADSFTFAEGEESLEYLAAVKVFEERGVEVVPTIFASAISSGSLTEETYRYFADKMLEVFRREKDIDGIWLHLHGSMEIDGVGSGEAKLLREIREIVGDDLPISLALDLHANIDEDVPRLANIIRGYRTAPHVDRDETEIITANLLVDALEVGETSMKPAFKRIYFITPGEAAMTKNEPMKTIVDKMYEYEEIEGILVANYFNGHAWTDAPNVSASALIVPESEEYEELAESVAEEFAEFVYDLRHEFKFDALTLNPDEAIERALAEEKKPVFISDSGDNTTGGASGINTLLLQKLTEKDLGDKKVLVAAIYDKETCEELMEFAAGDSVTVEVGVDYDENSTPVKLEGEIKAKGDLLGFATAAKDKVGDVVTVSEGNIDVAIANGSDSFVTLNHFNAAGLDYLEYDVIIVKQGYLFDELAEVSALDILCLSPGGTYLLVEELEFTRLRRPMYPLDK